MTKADQRDQLINAILRITLRYEGDRVCLSEHIRGDRGLVLYYVKGFIKRHSFDKLFRVWTTNGFVWLELMVTNASIDEPDISDLPRSVAAKYRPDSEVSIHNADHRRLVSELYDTIGTAPPPVWVSRPFTTVKCDEPFIDERFDGHISLHKVAHELERRAQSDADRIARKKPAQLFIPNGPAPVVIRHVSEMVKQERNDE